MTKTNIAVGLLVIGIALFLFGISFNNHYWTFAIPANTALGGNGYVYPQLQNNLGNSHSLQPTDHTIKVK